MKNFFDAAIAAIGGIIGFAFGAIDGLFYALIAFIVIDYITGVIVAACEKKLSSAVGFRGICKKVILLLVVAVAHIIDAYVIGDGSMLRTAVIFVFLANEGLSILENAGNMGVPIPAPVRKALEQIMDKENEKTLTGVVHKLSDWFGGSAKKAEKETTDTETKKENENDDNE